ncbi:MAG: hypothetical protein ACI9B8_002848, partial [Sulfitobacter sp.]
APNAGTGLWKKDTAFFANGKNSQWKHKLTPAQTKLFDEKTVTLLDEHQRAWLLRS